MFVKTFLCAIGTISAVNALPNALPNALRSSYAVKERHNVPRGWTRVGDASKSDSIHLAIGLKQSNEGAVEQHLLEVSDPAHSRHGQHLTAQEIQDLVRPSDETQELVKAWLEEHGITHGVHNPSKDFIHVLIPIEKAEQLLQTSYSTFQHDDGHTISRTPEWSLPLHLHDHIDIIQPTTSFFRPKPQQISGPVRGPSYSDAWWNNHGRPRYGGPHGGGPHGGGNPNPGSGNGAGPISQICDANFTTPDCIRTLYGTYDYKPQVPEKNSVAHTNYLNQTSYRKDILKFLQNFRPEAAGEAYKFQSIIVNNGVDNQDTYPAPPGDNLEAVLDSTQIISIAWPTKFNTWNVGGMPPFIPDINTPTDTNEPYLTWLDYVLGQHDLPYVISNSYGDDEQTVPESYARRACSGFAQLGARGISVFFSSGDAGVGSDGTCYSNDGKNTSMFLPAFPAGCPWVTTVGGTQNFAPEIPVSRFASGAGFSNYFPAPAYGQQTWDAYIKSLNGANAGLYNMKGRGYPDVAAQGNHDAVVDNGTIRTVGGTSASSPTFAAVISLVNDVLIAKGKPTLGFLNPWIYSGGYKALTDVTGGGSSYGCNTTGFPAQPGWDAVTGFGTPKFGELVEAAFRKSGSPGGYPHGGGGGGWGGGHGGHGGHGW